MSNVDKFPSNAFKLYKSKYDAFLLDIPAVISNFNK